MANTVTTVGKNYLAALLASKGTYQGDFVGLGTGTTAATAANTALQAEVGTRSQGTLSSLNNTFSVEAVFSEGNPATAQNITEAGLFTNTGTLLARTTFAPIGKSTTDTLRIKWTITIN